LLHAKIQKETDKKKKSPAHFDGTLKDACCPEHGLSRCGTWPFRPQYAVFGSLKGHLLERRM